jgi:L,D-peptidoglycan transpeptidase YkuD (ErfK/YbiS/YcfS/YnhG family)
VQRITPCAGWCDAAGHRLYNRPVRLPFSASHEAMWREDGLYDLVVELDWNIRPRTQGRGSAIFMHVAQPGYSPTAGCVALGLRDLRRVLSAVSRNCRLVIK